MVVVMCFSSTQMTSKQEKSLTSRKRKPNWTDEESLLLAQLIQKKQNIVRGKPSTGVYFQDKRLAWKEIVQAINEAFPHVQRTVHDCNKKWENLLAKARVEIKRQSNKEEEMLFEKLSAVTQIVISVLNLPEKKVQKTKKIYHKVIYDSTNKRSALAPVGVILSGTLVSFILKGLHKNFCQNDDGKSTAEDITSKQALIEVELSDPELDPDPSITPEHETASTNAPNSPARQPGSPDAEVLSDSDVQSPCSSSSSPPRRPAAQQEKFDLEMSVLRRQDKILRLQEEYYTLKIKLLKSKIKELS
ncbi:uncharacterized protein LOC112145664 isoform X1 [Oryzias melastigma]|uniref:uncharacterized protein LOC112145664 isoform X1 n=1 Tax=Oryzias melastigma TaxID=30732 RepID=UPI000CF8139A|nr:uncharacterized protein LOC112145664 isoform X1 [Oryzias melastigma]